MANGLGNEQPKAVRGGGLAPHGDRSHEESARRPEDELTERAWRMLRFRFEVQQSGSSMEEFLRGLKAVSLAGASVEFSGDGVALMLGELGHAGPLG